MKKDRILLVAAMTALLVSCGGKKGGMPNFGDNEFPVKTVGTSNADLQTSYPATIKGVQDVEIRPKTTGFITRVYVQEGQSVGAGQMLFALDDGPSQAQVRQAQAAVNTARAQVNTAKLTYDNSQKLFESSVIGNYELQTAKNTYESAQAQLAQAQASLSAAREALSFCYVKSPASGIIGSLPYKVGTLVSPSVQPALTTVSNNSVMEVYFSMAEKDMLEMTKTSGSMKNAIAEFPEVKLQLADGTIFNQAGHVSKVSGVIDAATGAVSMIARFPNPQGLLKSGGSGSIIIPKTASNSIVIPQQCVMEVQNKYFVYVLGAKNKVKYTEITVAPHNDGMNYVVTSGLKVGDKYVTNGLTKLSDNMEIKPITPEQYEKKVAEAEKLGENQSSPSKFGDAMK